MSFQENQKKGEHQVKKKNFFYPNPKKPLFSHLSTALANNLPLLEPFPLPLVPPLNHKPARVIIIIIITIIIKSVQTTESLLYGVSFSTVKVAMRTGASKKWPSGPAKKLCGAWKNKTIMMSFQRDELNGFFINRIARSSSLSEHHKVLSTILPFPLTQ